MREEKILFKKTGIVISVVVTIWNEEEENINELYLRLTNILLEIKRTYEIIFVDNASNSKVFNILHELYNNDPKVRIVSLTKNFGQAAAFLAGFEYSNGEIIVTLDSDLQNFPEDLPHFIKKIDEGFDVVSGWRIKRLDPFFTRIIPSYLMNKIITLRTGKKLHDWGSSFCAINKRVLVGLNNYGANARFIKPLISNITNITEIQIKHNCRKRGRSKYIFFSLALLAFDFLINYSLRPKGRYDSLFTIKKVY